MSLIFVNLVKFVIKTSTRRNWCIQHVYWGWNVYMTKSVPLTRCCLYCNTFLWTSYILPLTNTLHIIIKKQTFLTIKTKPNWKQNKSKKQNKNKLLWLTPGWESIICGPWESRLNQLFLYSFQLVLNLTEVMWVSFHCLFFSLLSVCGVQEPLSSLDSAVFLLKGLSWIVVLYSFHYG